MRVFVLGSSLGSGVCFIRAPSRFGPAAMQVLGGQRGKEPVLDGWLWTCLGLALGLPIAGTPFSPGDSLVGELVGGLTGGGPRRCCGGKGEGLCGERAM